MNEGWRHGFRSVEAEFPDWVRLPLEGDLPADLRGTLYLAGPAQHHVGGDRNASWLDGDGMAHALRVDDSGVRYRARFVATAKKRAEDAAGRRIFATLGSVPAGGPLRRLLHPFPRSTANGGIVRHGDRLLALWSGGRPYALDPDTLETLGQETLGGRLKPWHPFSATPVTDPETGDLWNVGIRWGLPAVFRIYRCPPGGRAEVVAAGALPRAPGAAAFGLSRTRAVLVLPPLVAPFVPLRVAAGRRAMLDVLEWQPERGTTVITVDRRSGEVRRSTTEAMMVSSLAQAFDDADDGDGDADLVVDLSTFPDGSLLEVTREAMGGEVRTQTYATLRSLRIAPDGHVATTLWPPLDGARVASPALAGPDARIFGVTLNPLGGYMGLPAAVDRGSGKVTWAVPEADSYAGQPVPVPRCGATAADHCWVLCLVLDAAAERSELRVLDGEDITRPPVAVAVLPHVVPFGFQGSWASQHGP